MKWRTVLNYLDGGRVVMQVLHLVQMRGSDTYQRAGVIGPKADKDRSVEQNRSTVSSEALEDRNPIFDPEGEADR